MSVRLVLCLGASLVAFAAPQAAAEDFYSGKSISVLVGAGAGGSYDVYARTLATHMQRHIPGQPSIIVKIAGGVGGGVATAVQMELHKNYGVVMKVKDLQNIKQAQTGMLIISSIICLPTN